MRGIEFRVWEPINQQMHKMELALYETETKEFKRFALPLGNQSLNDGSYCSMNLDSVIVEQFTGLHDKNSKEIYENDIVRDKFDEIWQVEYMDEYAAYILVRLDDEFKETNFIGQIFNEEKDYYNMEVIGNIHEGVDA